MNFLGKSAIKPRLLQGLRLQVVNRTHEIRKEKLPVTVAGIPKLIARGLIRCYQVVLSPFIGNQCRFHPSCSNYALEAIERFGAMRGSWLSLRRLGRCHPLNPGGFDPVPECADAANHHRPRNARAAASPR